MPMDERIHGVVCTLSQQYEEKRKKGLSIAFIHRSHNCYSATGNCKTYLRQENEKYNDVSMEHRMETKE